MNIISRADSLYLAFEMGYETAQSGENNQNPYHDESEEFESYDRGYFAGIEDSGNESF